MPSLTSTIEDAIHRAIGFANARRHELATLLGYTNWADYVTEDKMVKSAASARAFFERIAELARHAR